MTVRVSRRTTGSVDPRGRTTRVTKAPLATGECLFQRRATSRAYSSVYAQHLIARRNGGSVRCRTLDSSPRPPRTRHLALVLPVTLPGQELCVRMRSDPTSDWLLSGKSPSAMESM